MHSAHRKSLESQADLLYELDIIMLYLERVQEKCLVYIYVRRKKSKYIYYIYSQRTVIRTHDDLNFDFSS